MANAFEPQRFGPTSSHHYAMCDRGRVDAVLQWRQPAHDRRLTGWDLTRLDEPDGGRRLFVDVALEQLAAESEREALEWAEDADSAATLSAPLALSAARSLPQAVAAAPDPGTVARPGS